MAMPKVVGGQILLKCTCCRQEIMGVADGVQVTIRIRKHGEEHILVLTRSDLDKYLPEASVQGLTFTH